MLKALAVSLLLTLALEEAFAIFVWGLRGRRELGLVALVNCLTNPPVVLLRRAFQIPAWPLEVAAIVVEWWCYRAFSEQIGNPYKFALTANAFSYVAGVIIRLLVYRLFL